jgi:LysM repeat protein
MARERSFMQSWGPRVLAPLAFFLAATVLILLVNNAIEKDSNPAASTPADTTSVSTAPTATGTTTTQGGPKKRTFYRIKPGDTLETVANKKNTTVDDLIQLNPNIDPNNLQPGQRIRVS